MLIRFQAANYRSLFDPVELSMVAVDRDRPEARPQEPLGESLLPVAGIYGPNASGKSNVVAALAWLREAVAMSLRTWDDAIPVDPFAFSLSPDQSSQFELELAIGGVRFEYLLELNSEKVLYEALFHYPKRYRRRIFEREEGVIFQQGVSGQAGVKELLTPRTLVLSAARRFDDPLVGGFVNELLQVQTIGQSAHRSYGASRRGSSNLADYYVSTMRLLLESGIQNPLFVSPYDEGKYDRRDQVLSMLRMADIGIDDVDVVEEAMEQPSPGFPTPQRRRVRFLHHVGSGRTPLELDQESEGTMTWFRLIGPLLEALRTGSLMVVDELDASLHPRLSAELLRIFHSPDMNPHGAQLVFTAHDVSLLSHLNRDEVWFTEKRSDGSTRLGSLAEFAGERVRKSKDLESAYLNGRFGAIPNLDQVELLRGLGLIG